jgi:hypothetical protein
MSYADSGSLGRILPCDASRPLRALGALDPGHFPASYRDGTAIGAAQFLRPDNMQSSWREMSISFINKK